MNLTSFGHSCLFLESEAGAILIDPGNVSTGFESLTGLGLILITHTHADHLDLGRLPALLAANKGVRILSNQEVVSYLAEKGIAAEPLADGASISWNGLTITAHEAEHESVYPTLPRALNTGWQINDILFHPGDAWIKPPVSVEVLAVPVGGPWLRVAEGIDYALAGKPKIAVPIHDGFLKQPEIMDGLAIRILQEHQIEFKRPTSPLTI